MIGKEKEIIYVKEQIKVYFNIKDITDIDFVIGIKFRKYYNGYFMQKRGYIKELLVKFKLKNYLPVKNLKSIENLSLRKESETKHYTGAPLEN